MLILTTEGKAEIVIKKSRFISEMMTVDSQDAARETLRAQKERWAAQGITHLVHAFVVGPTANVMGCSDDGEPPGTAGRPVLEVLKGSGITNAMLTVARFFGGIKLGTGGLVKAYTESAQEVLKTVQTTEWVPKISFQLECSYPIYEKIKQILSENEAVILTENFTNAVLLSGTVRESQFETLQKQCQDVSRGQCNVKT